MIRDNLSIEVENPTPLQCRAPSQLGNVTQYGDMEIYESYQQDTLTDTFEILSEDETLILLFTNMDAFEALADSDHYNRNSSYRIEDENEFFDRSEVPLYVGDRTLLYLYPLDYLLYENFW